MAWLRELKFFAVQIAKNFDNERALRGSFWLQILGMFISNLSFFVIWIFFSKAVGTVNGWGALETYGMLSVSIFVFGAVHSVFGGITSWPAMVPTGAFDSFLTKPKSLYLRVMSYRFAVAACGDLIQGAIGIAIFIYLAGVDLKSMALFFAAILPAVFVHATFLMLLGCVVFWLPQARNLEHSLYNFLMLPATQPISMLTGPLRFIYLFVVPALVVAGLPIEIFVAPAWSMVLLAYGIAAFWLVASIALFYASVRRYESGNSIGGHV